MAFINDQFAAALKARVPERFGAALAGAAGGASPGAARQAEVPEPEVAQALAEALQIEYAPTLRDRPASHQFLLTVPIAFARRHAVIALAGEDGVMPVAMADLGAWPQVQALSRRLGRPVRCVLAPREEILRAVNAAYQQQSGQAQRVIEELDRDDVLREVQETAGREDLLDVAGRAPVIKLVNLMLFEAVKRRASDVHVQPYEERLMVRYRVDGVLHDAFEPPQALHPEIISRIKVMGGMNIAERRIAQDGRATAEVGDRVVDLRIATLPTSFGERAVIRLLDKSARLYRLEDVGMPAAVLDQFRRLIRHDHGIVLVTGPTGSGKTTTLYAALQEINSKETNILTLEDPIEYRLEGISQTQVSDKKGMTFAGGLRHVLRQDPDVIMVGEIRDVETAHMAIQSALTGHLVFSTLHTNDAAGAVARILDLGAEPYLLASSLLGVLAQRLVRQVCPACRQEVPVSAADRLRWGAGQNEGVPERVVRGQGCPHCLETGYRDRAGIFELLTVSEPIRELILQRAKASSIKAVAIREGMGTLRAAGIEKVLAGVTTMDEVARVAAKSEF
ncbi:MAG: type II secretion system ATPase GspE [Planctomycetota bacterium]|nr:type II secretion system ATPase GspE [Planctomycetota bacterium]